MLDNRRSTRARARTHFMHAGTCAGSKEPWIGLRTARSIPGEGAWWREFGRAETFLPTVETTRYELHGVRRSVAQLRRGAARRGTTRQECSHAHLHAHTQAHRRAGRSLTLTAKKSGGSIPCRVRFKLIFGAFRPRTQSGQIELEGSVGKVLGETRLQIDVGPRRSPSA